MDVGYVNPKVKAMYGKSYSELTATEKAVLHADSERRAKLISERQEAVLKNNLKAFEDEAKMEKVLASIYSESQKTIIADVTETIAKVQKAGGEWSYANQSALTRSRGLFEQISEELTKLGQAEQQTFYESLSNIYSDQFMRQVYELGQSITVKANFNRLNTALIRKTLDYPWSGAMFSDRLWNDKVTLGKNLRLGLTQSMILGESIPEITERINKNINTSKYNAERVARTETKRVTYCAHDDVYEDMGVEELEYRCANGGDERTCQYCRADNGKHYKRGEEPTLPRHPNCRCVYIPVVSDEFGENELNELTDSVRGAENYDKWKEAEEEKIKASVPKTVSKNEQKYNDELDKIDIEYRAKNAELVSMQENYNSLETQYKSYNVVRRGLQLPEEAGFSSQIQFDQMDKELSRQIQSLKKKIESTQEDLKDLMRDRQYLLKVGVDKVDTLEDYRIIRTALRNNSRFDYVTYGDELMETIAKMDVKEIALQAQFYKNGSYAPWKGYNLTPSKVFKGGAISDVRIIAQTSKIQYNEVSKLEEALSEDEIIARLAGGDMTQGSCASLSFAYAGNKSGLDVLDFRGGKSQDLFSRSCTDIATLPSIKTQIYKVEKEASDVAKILSTLEYDKEYILATGKHAAIVKNTKNGLMYLELQSSDKNGWMSFNKYGSTVNTLKERFGCRKTVDKAYGMVFKKTVELMEVDSFKGNKEFEKILGYINTSAGSQKKGVSGSVK